MSTTSSAAALLHVALQDLCAGKEAQAERLPPIAARCSDPALRDLIAAEAGQAAMQAARLRGTGELGDPPENLWMTGTLDDAERDTRATQAGRLLDIALIGAIRKAKAAEIVSSETAIALAREVGSGDILEVVTANREEEIATDQQLKRCLYAFTGT